MSNVQHENIEWLTENAGGVGKIYASELNRHYL